jgi:hypothetical protein
MRTTLTIADRTDSRLRRIAQEQSRSYKDVINDALALGLAQMEVHEAEPPYRVETFEAALVPGVDRQKLNQLVDEVDLQS